jgi:hypothetical protein
LWGLSDFVVAMASLLGRFALLRAVAAKIYLCMGWGLKNSWQPGFLVSSPVCRILPLGVAPSLPAVSFCCLASSMVMPSRKAILTIFFITL